MKFQRYFLLLAMIAVFSVPGPGQADDQFGIGGSDYMMDDGAPDLLGEGVKNGNGVGIYDPLEPMNRVFFTFNDKLYFWVLKPVKQGYMAVVPWDFRFVIGNFFSNLASPVDFVNSLGGDVTLQHTSSVVVAGGDHKA